MNVWAFLEMVIFVHDLGENKFVSIDDIMGTFWVHFGEMSVRIGCAQMYSVISLSGCIWTENYVYVFLINPVLFLTVWSFAAIANSQLGPLFCLSWTFKEGSFRTKPVCINRHVLCQSDVKMRCMPRPLRFCNPSWCKISNSVAAVDNTEVNHEIDCNLGKLTFLFHGHLADEVVRSHNLVSVITGTFMHWRLHIVF